MFVDDIAGALEEIEIMARINGVQDRTVSIVDEIIALVAAGVSAVDIAVRGRSSGIQVDLPAVIGDDPVARQIDHAHKVLRRG